MQTTHHRDFLHKVGVLLVFVEFIILISILIGRQRRTHLNLAPSPALQAPPQPQLAPRRRKKPPNTWFMPSILQRQEKGCYSNLLANLICHCQYATCIFYLIEKRVHHRIKKSVTNFRKPLEIRLKLAITLRHLVTGETFNSLQYHWLVGHL